MKPIVAVLAGGNSKRMGRDKAAITVNGKSMLRRVVRAAREAGLHVIVIGRESGDLPPDLVGHVDAVPDDTVQWGPKGGLATALRIAAGTDVILCGCDMPHVTPECFHWLLSETTANKAGEAKAIIPQMDGRAQPLFAYYRGDVLPLVLRQLKAGHLAMHEMFRTVTIQFVDVPSHLAAALLDVDTPAELERLDDAGGAGFQ